MNPVDIEVLKQFVKCVVPQYGRNTVGSATSVSRTVLIDHNGGHAEGSFLDRS